MSRIGKLPVPVPGNVEIKLEKNFLTCKGPKGELSRELHPAMKIEFSDGQITVHRPDDSNTNRALHGLTRSLIANMVTGVAEGFSKKLEIVGVGFKAEMKGKSLLLNVGYSHPIIMSFPSSVNVNCPGPTEIEVSGADKELVGMIAAKIRSFRKPEPYKGKGIRYSGEKVRRKAGKTGA